MDITTILQEVDKWPIEERIQLAEAIWDRVAEYQEMLHLSESQLLELDWRLEALKADPNDVIPWEEVQRFVRRSR
jgi:putative addiction module component (TIGR02574 family)